jgi:prepilin-type N-terminal cleavage/methylation domain-containing protein
MSRSGRQAGFTLLETLFVVGLIGVISVIAVPMFGNAITEFRISGDARSVSNAIAVAKMRAAANFSRVRLYVDLSARTHSLQFWNKTTSAWDTEGGAVQLNSGVSFSFGVVAAAPPNTQTTIAQAPACVADDGVTVLANTACIIFNSRGVPVDPTLAPTGLDALYVTNGAVVYGVTVAATGMLRTWRTRLLAAPEWMQS